MADKEQAIQSLAVQMMKRAGKLANLAGRGLASPHSRAKRYVRQALKLIRLVYAKLAFGPLTRARHKLFLAKHAPWMLDDVDDRSFAAPVLSLPNLTPWPPEGGVAASSIRIASSSEPIVSVIIPIHGKCDYTLRCLASIAANPPATPFEVVVVDDCSPDNSVEVLRHVEGIRLIRNSQNQGFIRSCNNGAIAAKGQYVYFLNNDTEVCAAWLDELLRTFHEFPGTGLAGSKLVYPDGKLQEAGGIIWQDGSAWNFGRNQDPLLPVYNYAREVDYCSGASIMVPKMLFDELGGFDEHYLPAFGEDADLALKLRDQGYRVIYQSLSVIFHYEGITSGTDITQGVKAYQVENSNKLFERWKGRLEHHQAPGTHPDKAKDRVAKRRVLLIDHGTPTPNQDAGSLTAFNLMMLLREMGFQVTFIPEDNFLYMPDDTAALQRAGIEVLYAPYFTSVEQHLKISGGRYDLALLFRPVVAERHLKSVRKFCPKAKVLYHTSDLHFLRMLREAQLGAATDKKKLADEMKLRELAVIKAVDASIVHSPVELELLRSELPNAKIHVLPLILDVPGTGKSFADRRDVVFVGGYQHSPNVDAVQYFVSEIMPLLRSRIAGVRFNVVGSKLPPEIRALASKDVIVTGFVEDLSTFLDRMRVFVAPLRYGAGVKGKIGTAMAAGLPTVATSIAAEGMSLTNGDNILVADGAEPFAGAVALLHEDESLWNGLSKAGLDHAQNAWGAETAWENLNSVLGDLGLPSKRGIYPLKLWLNYDAGQSRSSTTTDRTEDILSPTVTVRNRAEFEEAQNLSFLAMINETESALLARGNTESFTVEGFCVPCEKAVPFIVDAQSGGQRRDNHLFPNWRERLECPICHMNNRQRLVATLVKQQLASGENGGAMFAYFMEQVTPIFHWASKAFPQHTIIGSEYLGRGYASGAIIRGLHHENAMNLSFDDCSIDLIISNDVFEHVPDPKAAFRECSRVLRPGGFMLSTFPFHTDLNRSVLRAELTENGLRHLLPPVHHGNPLSADGSLVFTDFGWDVLRDLQEAGFSEARAEIYASADHGHLGGGQLVFVARNRRGS